MRKITNREIYDAASSLADIISDNDGLKEKSPIRLYGVPRGGVPAAYAVKNFLGDACVVDNPDEADVIIDDVVDSGDTLKQYIADYMLPAYSLFYKHPGDPWFVFPWEAHETPLEDCVVRLLEYIGEDPKRGGLLETPRRVVKAWDFFTQGYKQDPKEILKVFEDGAEKYDQMVFQRSIPFFSKCEHHAETFFGEAHVAYIPNGKIVGLSKLSRLVDIFARRLQVQERMTNQIADALNENLQPLGVGVVLQCRHLCQEARGVQKIGTVTVTSALRGAIKDEDSARAEFLAFARGLRSEI